MSLSGPRTPMSMTSNLISGLLHPKRADPQLTPAQLRMQQTTNSTSPSLLDLNQYAGDENDGQDMVSFSQENVFYTASHSIRASDISAIIQLMKNSPLDPHRPQRFLRALLQATSCKGLCNIIKKSDDEGVKESHPIFLSSKETHARFLDRCLIFKERSGLIAQVITHCINDLSDKSPFKASMNTIIDQLHDLNDGYTIFHNST